jgi:hypothetical protein
VRGVPRALGPVNGHPVGNVPAGAVPSVKCAATNRAGDPCGRWAIVGGSVCPTHGGSAPQVIAAARERIQSQVPLALQVQEELLNDRNAPAAVRARVADSVLDRSGLKPADVQVLLTEEAERPDLGAAMAKVLQSRGLMEPDAEVLDAEAEDA